MGLRKKIKEVLTSIVQGALKDEFEQIKAQNEKNKEVLDSLEKACETNLYMMELSNALGRDTQNVCKTIEAYVEQLSKDSIVKDALGQDTQNICKSIEEYVSQLKKMGETLYDMGQDTQNICSSIENYVNHITKVFDETNMLIRQKDELNRIVNSCDVLIKNVENLKDNVNSIVDTQIFIKELNKDNQNILTFIQSRADYLTLKADYFTPLADTVYSYSVNGVMLEDYKNSEVYEYYRKIHDLLSTRVPIEEYSLKRIGAKNDGGYIMYEPFSRNKIAYSLGIGGDVSWDLEMANEGYRIYQYDHTIDALPIENEMFIWRKVGVGKEESKDYKSLKELLSDNSHANCDGMVLKMDIEGSEWDVINECGLETLKKFDQIIIEFHGLTNIEKKEEIMYALKHMCSTHSLIHIHGNNYSKVFRYGDLIIPDVIEATFVSKDYCETEECKKAYPTMIDSPNREEFPDVWLGIW